MMERVSKEERARFHKILDDSIDKMNSPKNSKKCHWSTEAIGRLQKFVNTENAELEAGVYLYHADPLHNGAVVETENFDLINLNMMMVDNLRGNK